MSDETKLRADTRCRVDGCPCTAFAYGVGDHPGYCSGDEPRGLLGCGHFDGMHGSSRAELRASLAAAEARAVELEAALGEARRISDERYTWSEFWRRAAFGWRDWADGIVTKAETDARGNGDAPVRGIIADRVARADTAERERDQYRDGATEATLRWVAAERERDRLRVALNGIRDRYVKRLPGKDKPTCTLCGRDDGTHYAERNCGLAYDATATPGAPTTQGSRAAEVAGRDHAAEARAVELEAALGEARRISDERYTWSEFWRRAAFGWRDWADGIVTKAETDARGNGDAPVRGIIADRVARADTAERERDQYRDGATEATLRWVAAERERDRLRVALTWIGEHCDAEIQGLALAEIQHACVVALSMAATPATPGTPVPKVTP